MPSTRLAGRVEMEAHYMADSTAAGQDRLILEAAEALMRCGDNQVHAAARVGISRSGFRSRLLRGVAKGILNDNYTIRTGHASTGDTVLVISDTHGPFQHPDTIPFLSAVKAKYQPTRIVHIGDEVDNHAISDYPTDPDGHSARREYDAALEFMLELYDLFPEVWACESNHTSRAYRKAFKVGLPRCMIRSYGEVWKAPLGWQWADRWVIDDVIYFHGEGTSGVRPHARAAERLMQSCVIGHVHAGAGVQVVQADKGIFGMNVGCLINRNTYAMRYAKHMLTPVTLGCGIVHQGRRADFVPLLTDGEYRWTGEL